VAIDLLTDEKHFLVGDIEGYIHVMETMSLVPVCSFKAIEMSMTSAIVAMTTNTDEKLVFFGTMHGYVGIWSYHGGQKLEYVRRLRAHYEPLISLSYSEQFGVLTTVGTDGQIRLWSLNPFAFVGELGKTGRWEMGNPSTYKGTEDLGDDPTHFAVRGVVNALSQTGSIKDSKSRLSQTLRIVPTMEDPEVDFGQFAALMEEGDKLIKNGRKWGETAEEVVRK
jgi:WD40 repeat protein